MPDDAAFRRRSRAVIPLLALAVLAAFTLASWSFYNGHRAADARARDTCKSNNVTLNVLADILRLTEPPAPPPGSPLTERQKRARAFYKAAYSRIDKARCRGGVS